ncbi:MAG: hypothetical protein RBR85_01565 [Bacilli bacterium]|jgi:hypothetical protein|nr:hypothetical protein [Bacilli bacterium]NLB48985.1 hypothetical protein [Erysipelotrichia bacterium]
MSAFEKIIQLEQNFLDRKDLLKSKREQKLQELENSQKAQLLALEKELRVLNEKTRSATDHEVKKMHDTLNAELELNEQKFKQAFKKEKENIVERVFNEVQKL